MNNKQASQKQHKTNTTTISISSFEYYSSSGTVWGIPPTSPFGHLQTLWPAFYRNYIFSFFWRPWSRPLCTFFRSSAFASNICWTIQIRIWNLPSGHISFNSRWLFSQQAIMVMYSLVHLLMILLNRFNNKNTNLFVILHQWHMSSVLLRSPNFIQVWILVKILVCFHCPPLKYQTLGQFSNVQIN